MKPTYTLGRTLLGLVLSFSGLGLIFFFLGGEDSHNALITAELDGRSSTQILIDIKPHDFPNGFNPRSNGVIPVAILTNADFDARTVDLHKARFGKYGNEAPVVQSTLMDVDGDRDRDLLLHFSIQDTGLQCGDTTATFTGQTFSGQAITGSDSIVPVGCR
jgi:hypothetical protein